MQTEMDFAYCETAYLQSDDKEFIILEIVNGTSNYGDAEYHIFHVEDDSFRIVEDVIVLNEQNLMDTDTSSGSLIVCSGNVSMTNAESLITTIKDKPAVQITVWNSDMQERETYYLYFDEEWKYEHSEIGTE